MAVEETRGRKGEIKESWPGEGSARVPFSFSFTKLFKFYTPSLHWFASSSLFCRTREKEGGRESERGPCPLVPPSHPNPYYPSQPTPTLIPSPSLRIPCCFVFSMFAYTPHTQERIPLHPLQLPRTPRSPPTPPSQPPFSFLYCL